MCSVCSEKRQRCRRNRLRMMEKIVHGIQTLFFFQSAFNVNASKAYCRRLALRLKRRRRIIAAKIRVVHAASRGEFNEAFTSRIRFKACALASSNEFDLHNSGVAFYVISKRYRQEWWSYICRCSRRAFTGRMIVALLSAFVAKRPINEAEIALVCS